MRAHPPGVALPLGQGVPGGVEALPHLGGDDLAGAAGVLPGAGDRRDDRRGLVGRVADELGERPGVQRVARRAGRQPSTPSRIRAARVGVDGGVLQQLVHRDVEDARRVVGPLDVAADPVQRLGVAGEHQPSPRLLLLLLLLAASCSSGPVLGGGRAGGMRPSRDRGGPARGRRRTPGRRRAPRCPCCPPPWLELTTRLPFGSATRVRPPGSTNTSSPSLTANGRRSTCRGTSLSSTLVGTVESCTTGCAIQPRGSSRIARRADGELARARVRAEQDAVAARALHRLEHQLVQLGQHVVLLVGQPAAERVDVGQQRLLAQVVGDHVRARRCRRACRRPRRCPPRSRSRRCPRAPR